MRMRVLLAGAWLALLAGTAPAQNRVAPTPPPGDNSNRIATTAFVQNALTTSILAVPNTWTALQSFNGGATAPTRSNGDNTTNVATTAFVQNVLGVANTWTALQAFNSGATAPTRTAGDSTTNVATTAFVGAALANILTTPNTWTALQTFSAGIAASTTTALASPFAFAYGPSLGTMTTTTVLSRMDYNDGVTCTACAQGIFLDALAISHSINAGSGDRQTLLISTDIPVSTTWVATTNNPIVSTLVPTLTIEANVGGTSPTHAGGLFTFNPTLAVAAAATFLQEVAVAELNLQNASASTSNASMLKLETTSAHSQHAALEASLVFTGQSGGVGMNNLILIGNYNGAVNPCASAGCSVMMTNGNPGFKFGIDFSGANPTGTDLSGGFPFRSGINGVTNFAVNWSGNITTTNILPTLTINSTAAGSWKSQLFFQNSATPVYTIGIDILATGAHQAFFYDQTNTNMLVGPGVQIGSPTGGDKGLGTLNIQGTIWTNGTQGIATRTCTVNQALTLIFTNGILTGGTCVT